MRSPEEIRAAITVLGASFTSRPLRAFVWGAAPEDAREAWSAFQALGWVVGADQSGFAQMLAYATLKLEQYVEGTENNHHVQ